MNWGSVSDFLSMGGHARYVWGAYGLTVLVMALEPWLATRRRRRALEAAGALADAEPRA
jgi:heme exporter protein D